MKASNPIGLLSVATGAVALLLLASWRHWESLRGAFSNSVLMVADSLGLVSPSSAATPDSISAPGLLALNDSSALAILFGLGIYFALTAILLSFRAQSKGESTLYVGAGFVCGAASLVLISYYASLLALLIGGTTLVAIRHRRQA